MFDTSGIYLMLDKVQAFLGQWLEEHLRQIYPTDWWERCVMSVLVPEQCENVLDDGAATTADIDLAMQITVFRGNWNLLRRKFHLNPQLYDDAAAVKRIRNKYSHKKSGKDYEERFEHDMETVKLFLKGLGAPPEDMCDCEISSSKNAIGTDVVGRTVRTSKNMIIATNAKSTASVENPLETPKKALNGINPNTVVEATQEINNKNVSNTEDWTDVVSLLYDNIQACLKDEYSEVTVGDFLRLRKGDPIPNGISLLDGWQQAVVLHIKDANRDHLMQGITKFIYGDHVPTKPYVRGEYAIWQFPQPVEHETRVKLLTTVFLPQWLTQYLYEERGLCYKTNCETVQNNLNADREFSFQYLSTYFPRTFAEMSSIFDFVFATRPPAVCGLGENVSILDVGCGSGAAAIALLWSMKKARLTNLRKVVVHGLDGNENFIERFRELIPVIQRVWPAVEIEVLIEKVTDDMETSIRNLPDTARFDFIVSSKFTQELRRENAYDGISALCQARLKDDGIMCMLETYREGRTEHDSLCANKAEDCQVFTSNKVDFSVMQIPGCSCVNEIVGFQLFIKQPKEQKHG